MKKNSIILTIFIILGMISLTTIYKISNQHKSNMVKVVEEEFLYQALICYNKQECNEIVYLKDLYQKEYLKDKLTNPINKRYYNEESYVNVNTKEVKLIS